MAAIAPVLTTIMQVGSVLGTVASIAQPFIADKVQRNQTADLNALKLQQDTQAAQTRLAENQMVLAQNDEKRRAALKRSIARQRANFGAQGVGSNGGSSEAVLLGMFEMSDAEREAAEQLNGIRTQAVAQSLGAQQQLNLLQQTQLKERQYVDYLSKLA